MTLMTQNMAVLAAAIRALPLAPDTHDDARQRWLRENAARLVEGKEPITWEFVQLGKLNPSAVVTAFNDVSGKVTALEERVAKLEREIGRT